MKTVRIFAASSALALTAACGGSSGTTSGPGFETLDDRFDAIISTNGTETVNRNLPTSGRAVYEGAFRGIVTESLSSGGRAAEQLAGRATVTAKFGEGRVDGRVDQIAGETLGAIDGRITFGGSRTRVAGTTFFDGNFNAQLALPDPETGRARNNVTIKGDAVTAFYGPQQRFVLTSFRDNRFGFEPIDLNGTVIGSK